jgi:uncharacterized protein YoaH (UPF0181 family)
MAAAKKGFPAASGGLTGNAIHFTADQLRSMQHVSLRAS